MRNRCRVFAVPRAPAPSPQTRAAAISAGCAWLPLLFQSQYAPHHAGNPLPILGLNGELLLAPRGDGAKLGPCGYGRRFPTPQRSTSAAQRQQPRVHRTFVQLQYSAVDLLDRPGNPKAILRPHACSVLRIIESSVPCNTSDFPGSVMPGFLCTHQRKLPFSFGMSIGTKHIRLAATKCSQWLSLAQASVFPPFTEKRCPVMKRAASLARKATSLATSSGMPIRFIGTVAA
jgi:hypothetical protein